MELPEDLFITDILPRLPLKSIGRFRCVSKLWRSWLSSPQFVRARIHDSPESIIIEDGRSLYISTPATKSCIKWKKVIYALTESTILAFVDGSCHGLVLLSHYNQVCDRVTKVLMNPVTLEAEEVVDYPSSELANHCGLGYDSLSDDYKIVTLTPQSIKSVGSFFVDIYSVKAKTWKRVADSKCIYYFNPGGQGKFDKAGRFVNGCILWKFYKPDFAIGAFNLAREEFEIVHLPSAHDQSEFRWASLIVLGGCLSLAVPKSASKCVDVWIMKEYGVQGSWMKITIPSPRPEDVHMKMVDAVCLLGDDEILAVFDRKKLMVCNWRNGVWNDVGIDAVLESYIVGSWTFTPSLISPSYNRLVGNTPEY